MVATAAATATATAMATAMATAAAAMMTVASKKAMRMKASPASERAEGGTLLTRQTREATPVTAVSQAV